jgi:hypothetical protein
MFAELKVHFKSVDNVIRLVKKLEQTYHQFLNFHQESSYFKITGDTQILLELQDFHIFLNKAHTSLSFKV